TKTDDIIIRPVHCVGAENTRGSGHKKTLFGHDEHPPERPGYLGPHSGRAVTDVSPEYTPPLDGWQGTQGGVMRHLRVGTSRKTSVCPGGDVVGLTPPRPR